MQSSEHTTAHSIDLVFPRPRSVERRDSNSAPFKLPDSWDVSGVAVPAWLKAHLAKNQGLRIGADASGGSVGRLTLAHSQAGFEAIADSRLRDQAYALSILPDASIEISSPSNQGLRHGLVTLSHLLRAAGRGAALGPAVIHDHPAFAVRGVQIDLAREYFPSMAYLKRMVDRLVDLKANTLWLYLENRFAVPGLEDISPPGGMTVKQAREISDYAAKRGIDVVPGTNLLSHMEGWFRLERYSDFADGAGRSYPVLTRPEAWDLVRRVLDALADAFPSKNFHAGLDELLFVGANPEAAQAIAAEGKPKYFADFACKVIDHLQAKGKTVWIWDDMVLGKNVYRKEGFNDEYAKALERIPRDVIMTHWYYWTDHDGKHSPMVERVAGAGRPFVVAPSSRIQASDLGQFRPAMENQRHMARVGARHGAFGLINTQWEARNGSCFETGWPLLALALGYAWSGPPSDQEVADPSGFLQAWGFGVGGGTAGELATYWRSLDEATDVLLARDPAFLNALRWTLIVRGPAELWRSLSPVLTQDDRRRYLRHIAAADQAIQGAAPHDATLQKALAVPVLLARAAVGVIDAMDDAWTHYHQASLVERDPSRRAEFEASIDAAVASIHAAAESMDPYRLALKELSATTGHTPYDAYALSLFQKDLFQVAKLVRSAAKAGIGLPYFERLLYRPDWHHISNMKQLQIRHVFTQRQNHTRWLRLPEPRKRSL